MDTRPVGLVRKTVSFCFALGLTSLGVWLLFQTLSFDATTEGSPKAKGFAFLIGGSLGLVGLVWLWVDFIAPLFDRSRQS